MLRTTVKVHGSEDYQLTLSFEDMNDMVERIVQELKDWQNWESMERTLRHFEKSETEIQESKDSGFYYIEDDDNA